MVKSTSNVTEPIVKFPFIARNGTINMTGTSAQTITSPIPTSFHNLTINNSYATDPQITLNNPAIVTGTLTLTDGVVLATSGNVLSMAGGSSTTIGSATSYINGTMTYDVAAAGATSINFPIGKSTSWRPAVLNVTHSDASSVTYTAEMFNTSATSLGYTLPPTINKVSGWRYWQIDRSGAANFTNATVRLYYSTTPNDDGVTDYTNLAVVKTVGTGTVWVDYSGTATANGTGSILSTAFTSFSKFTLANKLAGSNPLPIELLSFDAVLNNNKQVDVKWATATEISNDYFTVERSADGISFEEVGSVDGAGNSNSKKNYALVDASPLQGISYYRLKQTDFNGTYTYSQIASVELIDKDIPFVSLYPNPSDGDYLNLKFKNINTNESISIKVMDNLGKQVYSSSVKLSQTDVVLPIAFKQQLAMGIYTIKIISSKEPIMTSKFTVIN